VIAAGIFYALARKPELFMRFLTDKINEDEAAEVSFVYDYEDSSKSKVIRDFNFTPSESGKYKFTVTDLESDGEMLLSMNVTDMFFEAYFTADNSDQESDEKGEISGSTSLQANQTCYVIFTVQAKDDDAAELSGSFKLTVSKDTGEEGPPQLTVGEPVTIEVKSDGQACAVFVPPETGYYRFENSIVSSDSSAGYSTLSSVTSSNKLKIGITNEICMLEQGKEYFIWIATNETGSRKSEVELSCIPLKTEKASGICNMDISEGSVIEYIADKDCNLAVYTISEGDPSILIYETAGFPLRTDDRSEASLSDNPNDVATVLSVKKNAGLHICLYGDLTGCRVCITEYNGDGTTLTMDDLTPIPEDEKEAGDKAEEAADESNEETGEDN
jgi:hypothetical protein